MDWALDLLILLQAHSTTSPDLPSTPEAWASKRCPTPIFSFVNAGPRTRKKKPVHFSTNEPRGWFWYEALIPRTEGPHGDQIMLGCVSRLFLHGSWNHYFPSSLGPEKGHHKTLLPLPITIRPKRGFEIRHHTGDQDSGVLCPACADRKPGLLNQ